MIDEVQDLTRQQIEVVRMWEPKLEIMTIAGGPLQSIYGYLGGTPEFHMNWGAEEKYLPFSKSSPKTSSTAPPFSFR